MHALEFTSEIKDGIIKVPKAFIEKCKGKARIIVLQDVHESDEMKKEELSQILSKLKKLKAFAGISDPVKWQKEIRDEW